VRKPNVDKLQTTAFTKEQACNGTNSDSVRRNRGAIPCDLSH